MSTIDNGSGGTYDFVDDIANRIRYGENPLEALWHALQTLVFLIDSSSLGRPW